MAPTEGTVARPERRWGCHCGTPYFLRHSATLQCSWAHTGHITV